MFRRVLVLLTAALPLAGACDGSLAPDPATRQQGRGPGTASEECLTDTNPVVEQVEPPAPSEERSPVRIVVDPGTELGPIDPDVYGINHRYPYEGFGMWDTEKGRAHPRFVDRFEYAGFKSIRYPGGRTANNYHWTRAIGPVEDRVSHVDSAFGRISIHGQRLTNEFGPDEFGEFVRQTGTTASIVVNFATSDARKAADWVEYMNTPVGENPNGGVAWAEVRARNGSPEPYGVPFWEIGNELAGAKTFWLGETDTESDLARKYAFGGETFFEKQPVVTFYDYSPSASISTGKQDQELYVAFPPVSPGTEVLYVDDTEWKQVDKIASAGGGNVYEFDPDSGRIRFSDGTTGNIPPKGSQITMTHLSGPHDGFTDFYREMKEVDPTIEVGSALNSSLFMAAMGSEHPYDFLVAHSYSYFRDTPEGMGELHDLMMTMPDAQASRVQETQDAIRRYAGERAEDIDVALTEWAMSSGANLGLGRIDAPRTYTLSLDGGLYAALVLKRWIELDLPLAQKHSLIDIDPEEPPPGYSKPRSAYQAAIGHNPCFVMSSTGHVFHMFTRLMGDRHVASSVTGNPSRTIFNGSTLQSLHTIASKDDAGNVTVIVVNTDRSRAITAAIETSSFAGDGEALVWTIGAPSFTDYNSIERPNRIHIRETRLPSVDRVLRYRFPAHSITAFKLAAET